MTFHLSSRLDRFIASLVDGIVLLPLSIIYLFLMTQGYYIQLFGYAIMIFCQMFYFIFYVYKNETTIGKRTQELKIISYQDGARITLKQCAMRFFSYSFIGIVQFFIMTYLVMTTSPEGYQELGILDKMTFFSVKYAELFQYINIFNLLFICAMYLPILFHSERRSLADMIAGTIVVEQED